MTIRSTVSAEEETPPEAFALHPNYPNPFNPLAVIRFDVREPSHVTLRVFDALGRAVTTLVDAVHTAGPYEAVFDGSQLPSGVYLYEVQMASFRDIKRMVLVK